jgi:hypothetical protein
MKLASNLPATLAEMTAMTSPSGYTQKEISKKEEFLKKNFFLPLFSFKF